MNPEIHYRNQDAALVWAAINDDLDVIIMTLEMGANIHVGGDYALELAAKTVI